MQRVAYPACGDDPARMGGARYCGLGRVEVAEFGGDVCRTAPIVAEQGEMGDEAAHAG